MIYGFTYRGKHSYNDFGIITRSINRPVLPERRKRQTEIPMRDGIYNFTSTSYDVRPNQIQCFFDRATIPDLRRHIRKVAAWLSGESGTLIFDDEPDKSYTARLFTAISLEQLLTSGIFTLFFECDPFASGASAELSYTITANGQILTVSYAGTRETSCRLILTNAGAIPVSDICFIARKG